VVEAEVESAVVAAVVVLGVLVVHGVLEVLEVLVVYPRASRQSLLRGVVVASGAAEAAAVCCR
jgi:hypothetical protein